MSPAEMIKSLIEDYITNHDLVWNIAVGHGFSEADRQVTIIDSGGLPSNPKYLLDYPAVQIMVRGCSQEYLLARSVIDGIKDLCLGVCAQDFPSGDRIVSITEGSNIEYIGVDENNRHEFSYNLRLITEPSTNAQTNRLPL